MLSQSNSSPRAIRRIAVDLIVSIAEQLSAARSNEAGPGVASHDRAADSDNGVAARRLHTIAEIVGRHHSIQHHADGAAGPFRDDAVKRRACRRRIRHGDADGTGRSGCAGTQAIRVVQEGGVRDVDPCAARACGGDQDSGAACCIAIAGDGRVDDMELDGQRRIVDENAAAIRRRSVEVADDAIVHDQRCALKEADSVEAGRDGRAAVDIQAAKHDIDIRSVHDDARGAGCQGGPFDVLAGNGDGFRDRHGAESTWIDAVDDAARGCLGNRTGPCLAGGGAAAGIGVITHARHPGACCLGKNAPAREQE